MYKHILVAVDGSENSLRAIEQVAEIVGDSSDIQVDLASVIAIDVYSDMVYDPIEAHGDAQRELIQPALDILAKTGVKANVVLLHGRPADEIIRYAEKEAVDLLVIGSRGLNALQEFAIGSVSHKVIKHSKCPVLVVK
jgi:nucleotide-binding universal stress UspA family protein